MEYCLGITLESSQKGYKEVEKKFGFELPVYVWKCVI